MQRYGDRLLGYWEGREADLGMETGRTQVDGREDRGRGRNPGNSSEREGERAAVVAPSEAIEDHTRSERGNAEASEKSADNSQGGTAGEEVSTATDSVTQPETAKTATMDVDPPAPVRARGTADPDTALSSSRSSGPDPPPKAFQGPPSAPPPAQPVHPPWGKEREMMRSVSASYTDHPATSSGSLATGFRDWVRGEEVMGVMGNRMTSPMRD